VIAFATRERTDRFIADFRELIASTAVDPASPCEAACHRGLDRISATVDAVDYVTYANSANLNAAMRGTLLSLIEVRLMCSAPVLSSTSWTPTPSSPGLDK
jgi:hypothetical protein